MATVIGQRTGMLQDRDVAACKAFLTQRHDQLWRSRAWKDSLIEYVIPISSATSDYIPTNTYMPTKGVLILPSIFSKVIAARTSEHKLNVERPMIFYRVDQDSFSKSGTSLDYFLLSACAWELDTSAALSMATDNSTDNSLKLSALDLLNTDGVSLTRSNPVFDNATPVALGSSDRVDLVSKPLTTGNVKITTQAYPVTPTTTTIGQYIELGFAHQIQVGDTSTFLPGDQVKIVGNGKIFTYTVNNIVSPTFFTGTWLQASGDTPIGDGVVTGGANVFHLNTYAVISLGPTDTAAPRRQRIRLVDIPDASTTVRVLGKRTTPPFALDTDLPAVDGFEGPLLALGYYDMLHRDERGGTQEAKDALAEGASLTLQMESEEVQQAAHNSRVMPESGFGPDEFPIGPQF